MNSLRYVPGDWYALVTDENVVLLPSNTSAEQVNGLWAKLASKTTVESLLSELLALYQMDIAALPNFALVSRERSPHVVLRGAPELLAAGAQGQEIVSGVGIATWAERKLSASESWSLASGSAAPEHSFALPIQAGIVRVSSLELTTDSAQVQVAPVFAAPAEQPVDDPVAVPAAKSPAAEPAAAESGSSAQDGPAKEQVPQASEAAVPPADVVPISSVPVLNSAPEEVSEPAQAEAAAPTEGVQEADAAQTFAGEPEEAEAPEAADQAAEDKAPAPAEAPQSPAPANEPAQKEQTNSGPSPIHGSVFQRNAPAPASEATFAPAPSHGTVSAEQADDDNTFIPGRNNQAQASEASEDTQDPENCGEHPSFDSQPSLGSMLLGARGAAGTQYDTGEGDNSDTIIKPRSAGTPAAPAAEVAEPDEHTIIRGIKASKPAPKDHAEPKDGTESQVAITEFILARICSQRHPNPPAASTCRHCDEQLTGPAQQVRKPAMGRMIVRDQGGAREFAHALNRSVVLGRQPSASAVQAENTPRLLQVDSPSGDISRSHLHVRLEGWHVQLIDLGATNGTVLLREGQRPRRLSKNQEIMLVSGDVADLGDGVSLRFEDLP